MKRFLFSITTLIIFFASTQTSVSACQCGERPSVKQSLAKANAVFVGKVVSVQNTCADCIIGGDLKVTLEVKQYWKGVNSRTIILMAGSGTDDCGYSFKIGDSYLVYAYSGDDSFLHTNICTRTKPIADAQSHKDIRVLGRGRRL